MGELIGNQVHKPLNMTSFCTEGATIASILAQQVPRVLAMKPDLVLLIWDSDAAKDPSTNGYPTAAYNRSLTLALNAMVSKHVTVLVTSPLLLGENEIPSFSPWSNKKKLENYRLVTEEIATQIGAIYVDGRAALLSAIVDAGYCDSNAYPVCNQQGANTCGNGVVTVDGEHLNNNGAQIMAKLYADRLNAWFSPNYTDHASSSSTGAAKCFAAFETVELESGERKPFSEVSLGDRIRVVTVSGDGTTGRKELFSPVIALPHGRNAEPAQFHTLVTAHSSLTATPDHLVMAGKCGIALSLRTMSSVRVDDCVETTSGPAIVTVVKRNKLFRGVYTAVTHEPGAFLVVNGIVASPFAVNHAVADSFYDLHRFLHWLLPSRRDTLVGYTLLTRALEKFGNLLENSWLL